ncbi:MAG: spore germination protein [Roseburia sp.]|nr:spore germination protein [Roseburia sp.]
MFSKNNKISKRQVFRLLSYDLLGVGTLLLPSALAEVSGRNGMAAMLVGLLAGLVFVVLLGGVIESMKEGETYPGYLKRCFGSFFGMVSVAFYILYYLVIGGVSTYVFGHLIVSELLKEQSFYWICVGVLFLACYGISQGIEGRARVYEILFWFLMVPLFLMLFLAARDVQVERLFPLFSGGEGNFYTGCLYSFAIFSLCGFILFLTPFAKEKEKVASASLLALLFCGGVLFVLYAILQGIFGIGSMAGQEYPAVTLMSMVQIPGGFLERQDAIMVGIWFFTVFALVSSSMFYVSENIASLYGGKKRGLSIFLAAVLFFGIAVGCYRSEEFMKKLIWMFLYYGTPVIVAIPLLTCFSASALKQKKRVVSTFVVILCCVCLGGCSTTELENRKFPLAMGVDLEEESCRVSYKFQDLSAVADENANAESSTDFYIKDKDFYTAISQYANDSNKEMDYNHMKVLVLSKDFIEDEESMDVFLQICEKRALIARNTLLFAAEDAGKILSLDKNLDAPIGTYLEEMIESREDYRLKDTVTMGDLLNDRENEEQLLFIPVLEEKGGLPVIRGYYAMTGGIPKGEIGLNETMLSYLTQGKIQKLYFSMEDKTPVNVKRISAKRTYEGESHTCLVKIGLEASVDKEFWQTGEKDEVLENRIGQEFYLQLKETGEKLKDAPGLDFTNSFYCLGLWDKAAYQKYKGDMEGFLRNLEYGYEVKVNLVQ